MIAFFDFEKSISLFPLLREKQRDSRLAIRTKELISFFHLRNVYLVSFPKDAGSKNFFVVLKPLPSTPMDSAGRTCRVGSS
jgi:hypothetical protein